MKRDRIVAALKCARKSIRGTRATVFNSHCAYDAKAGKRVVTDQNALDWIAELDSVIAKIDSALDHRAGASTT